MVTLAMGFSESENDESWLLVDACIEIVNNKIKRTQSSEFMSLYYRCIKEYLVQLYDYRLGV